MAETPTLGPIQLVVVGLDNDKMKGQVARELHRATEKGDIRILDALAIQRTKDGGLVSLGATDLTPDQRVVYGAILGGLLGLGATGTEEGMEVGAEMGVETFADKNFGLSGGDIQAIAQDIPPGKTVLMVLFEHRWAVPVKEAIQDAGGVMLAQGQVRPETIIALGAGLTAPAMVSSPSSDMSQSEQTH
ncbi:MAG TPA: hypothetical protein VF510_13385 [Ktedonobacterales bacterium]